MQYKYTLIHISCGTNIIQTNMWFSCFSIFSIPQQYNGSWGYVLLRLIYLKEKHQIRQR